MKHITIVQDKSSPVIVTDDDDESLKEYTTKLSSILENNNVTILHTTTGSVILRPNRISSIIVQEIEDELKLPAKEQITQNNVESKETIEEDIITD